MLSESDPPTKVHTLAGSSLPPEHLCSRNADLSSCGYKTIREGAIPKGLPDCGIRSSTQDSLSGPIGNGCA